VAIGLIVGVLGHIAGLITRAKFYDSRFWGFGVFSGFLDIKNLGKDTKFITPRQIQMEL